MNDDLDATGVRVQPIGLIELRIARDALKEEPDVHAALAYDGIRNADLPIIQGTVQLGAFFIVIANLIVDIAYAFLDPRVRFS